MIEDAAELGRQLKAARLAQRRSLRAAAALVHMSYSTLDRLERGVLGGDQAAAAALDELYDAGGYLSDAYGRLVHPAWEGARRLLNDDHAQTGWQWVFPQRYTGDVWIAVRPTAEHTNQPYTVRLRWGPWRRTIDIDELTREGVTFLTGKNAED